MVNSKRLAQLKKGDRIRCKKHLVMDDDGTIEFCKDIVYEVCNFADDDGDFAIRNNSGNHHWLSPEFMVDYFDLTPVDC